MLHKIIFFGSSGYCLPILESLHKNFNLVGVITTFKSPVKLFTSSHNINVFTPKDKKELLDIKKDLENLKPDLAIVADYGLIIPKEIFLIPRYQTLNIHFSHLPKYRGPAPVQYTILNGEKSAWISVIIMDETMDTGNILWQKENPLQGNETTGSLYKKLFNNAASELSDIINQFAAGKLKPQKQNHSQATYTKTLTRENGFIPARLLEIAVQGISPTKSQLQQWSLSKYLPFQFCTFHFALCTECAVRALHPWPGLWTYVNLKDTSDGGEATISTPPRWRDQKRLKILKVHLEPPASQGDTLRGYHERLVLDLVQLEGKKPVTWKQFSEGYPDVKFQ